MILSGASYVYGVPALTKKQQREQDKQCKLIIEFIESLITKSNETIQSNNHIQKKV